VSEDPHFAQGEAYRAPSDAGRMFEGVAFGTGPRATRRGGDARGAAGDVWPLGTRSEAALESVYASDPRASWTRIIRGAGIPARPPLVSAGAAEIAEGSRDGEARCGPRLGQRSGARDAAPRKGRAGGDRWGTTPTREAT
jgi:hypothetical protein